jgi:hypothetical protein
MSESSFTPTSKGGKMERRGEDVLMILAGRKTREEDKYLDIDRDRHVAVFCKINK